MKPSTLTVYYDGLCPLCSREIVHYPKHAPAEAGRLLDITEPGFNPAAQAARGMHGGRLHALIGWIEGFAQSQRRRRQCRNAAGSVDVEGRRTRIKRAPRKPSDLRETPTELLRLDDSLR